MIEAKQWRYMESEEIMSSIKAGISVLSERNDVDINSALLLMRKLMDDVIGVG